MLKIHAATGETGGERAVHRGGRRFDPFAVVNDLAAGLRMGPVWRAFAADETATRYRRSIFGIGWIVVSFLIFVGGLALFFGSFASLSGRHFLIYVALGYAAFTFLIGNIVDGCEVFRASSHWIKSAPLPYSIYVYKSIFRSLFPFAIHFACSLLLMLILGWRIGWQGLLAVPAFLLYLVNAVWIQYFFGLVAARWRDVSHLMGALTRILFFMCPIMWVYEERTGLVRTIAGLNPLTHLITIFRAPLMGEQTTLENWAVSVAFTALGLVLATVAGGLMRRRVPFWV